MEDYISEIKRNEAQVKRIKAQVLKFEQCKQTSLLCWQASSSYACLIVQHPAGLTR